MSWVDQAVADLESIAQRVSPALRRRVESALERVATMNGASSLREALVRPASTPFVALVDACAIDLGLQHDPRTALLGRAMVVSYLYVRVQDDIVDEPDKVDRSAVYAAEVFLGEHLRLYSAAVPTREAMEWRSNLMERFAEVAAAEIDQDASVSQPDSTAWMGAKFLPMAVPLAGLALAVDRPLVADAITKIVVEMGTALQFLNDMYNVAEDAKQGHMTPILRRLVRSGVDLGSSNLRATLLSHPDFRAWVTEARDYAQRAESMANEAGLSAVASVARKVGSMVDAAPDRMCRLMLTLSV